MKSMKSTPVLIVFLFVAFVSAVLAADDCNKTFDVLDTNKNNVLTYDEFSKFEHLKKMPFADMKDFNKNKEGKVTFEAFCQEMFNKADKKHNGKIDRKEWEEFYNSTMQQ